MGKALVIRGANYAANSLDKIDLDIVHAENIGVVPASLDLDFIGASRTLTATVIPSYAEDPVIWASSDEDVAVVADGVVTVVGVGTCTITATAGSVSATCAVSVSVELTGYSKYKNTSFEAGTSSNRLTVCYTLLGTSSTTYARFLSCCKSEMPYDHLMCHYKFTKLVDGTYALITSDSDLSGGELRVWNQIGYPVPIPLPPNTTKVRFVCPDDLHGAYPLFFKRNVEAYPAGGTTDGRGHFSPWRSLADTQSGYTWPYAASHDVDVPDDCDSLIVTFSTDIDNGGTLINDMTDTQIEGFKILCM